MPLDLNLLRANLDAVPHNIAAAAARVGRAATDVTLVAITKYMDAELARALVELGVTDLGEGRPQQLWEKARRSGTAGRWHLVGHLQRNKVRRTLPLVSLIHSVDSERFLAAIDEARRKPGDNPRARRRIIGSEHIGRIRQARVSARSKAEPLFRRLPNCPTWHTRPDGHGVARRGISRRGPRLRLAP